MPDPAIEIRHGRFSDLTGPPQCHDTTAIAAANVELLGSMFDLTHKLSEFLNHRDVSPEIRALVRPGQDAVWVRGRAQRLFDIPDTTAEDRGEKTFFFASFLALIPDENGQYIGIPFQCSEHYGQTGLIFSSEDAPSEELQGMIARAFWELLLSDPTDIEDYRDSMLHPGAGVWLDFGIDDGEPFLEERP